MEKYHVLCVIGACCILWNVVCRYFNYRKSWFCINYRFQKTRIELKPLARQLTVRCLVISLIFLFLWLPGMKATNRVTKLLLQENM